LRTNKALLGYGIDSNLANQLVQGGYSVASLKTLPLEALIGLGLSTLQAKVILTPERPSIPVATLNAVLYKARWTCCICRDHKRGIVVHHLSPWSESKSHDEDNLVVLCVDHHDEAHTLRQMSLTLTPDRIRKARSRWLVEAEEASQLETEKIANMIRQDHRLFSPHRGAMPWGKDNGIIFGNDGYSPTGNTQHNIRTRKQIDITRFLLKKEGIDELAFATSLDAATWVLLVSSTEISLLNAMIWGAFEHALSEMHK